MSTWINVLPEAIISVSATLLLIISALANSPAMRDLLRWLAAFAVAGSAAALLLASGNLGQSADGWVVATPFSTAIALTLLSLIGWTILANPAPVDSAGEWFALLLFTALGALVLARVGNLPALFLGIEVLSIALYVLVAFKYTSKLSLKAGATYLVLAGFGSSFLVFGMALVYAAHGTFSIAELRQIALITPMPLIAAIGYGMFLVGVGFKLAAVPFHMWAPDVYESAPAPAAGLIASASKGAAIAALLPFAFLLNSHWSVFVTLCILSIIIGNILGLRETRVKRILAYSSVAHVGYVLLGFLAIQSGTPITLPNTMSAEGAILFYIVAYGIASVGSFTALSFMRSRSVVTLNDLHGLARTNPIPAACMLIFTVSLAGLPISVGFWGKLYLFSAAFHAGLTTIAIIGLVGSAIGLFYYLRIIMHLYMVSPETNPRGEKPEVTPFQQALLVLAAIAILVFSIWPDCLYQLLHVKF